MLTSRFGGHAAPKPALSRNEFLDLICQPYTQPTLAALLAEHFGYCLSGAHQTTEVRAMTGEPIALDALYDQIQSDVAFNTALHDAIVRLRR